MLIGEDDYLEKTTISQIDELKNKELEIKNISKIKKA